METGRDSVSEPGGLEQGRGRRRGWRQVCQAIGGGFAHGRMSACKCVHVSAGLRVCLYPCNESCVHTYQVGKRWPEVNKMHDRSGFRAMKH